MSDEGGVTPSEVAQEATPGEVTPRRGKGALGTWRASDGPVSGHRARVNTADSQDVEPEGKPIRQGVNASQRLNFGGIREGLLGKATVANRTRETRPSGMTWGACGTASHGSRTEAHREIYGIATEPLKFSAP